MQATREVLTPIAVYQLINQTYKAHKNTDIPVSNGITATAIVLKESGGDTGATNINSDSYASIDRGLWQWNSYWHPEISATDAFDKTRSTEWAYTISNAFTSFSPWIGHGATTIQEEFNRTTNNQQAYTNATTAVTGSASSSSTNTSGWTAAEIATIKRWDTNGDGQLGRDDMTDAENKKYQDLTSNHFDQVYTITTAVQKHLQNDTYTTGWLSDGDSAAIGAGITIGDADVIMKWDMIDSTNAHIGLHDEITGILSGDISLGIPGLDTVLGWQDAIGNFFSAIMSGSFWKRIGLGALGLFVIIMALILYNKDTIAKAGAAAL